jgi:hypothetical protein
MIETRLWNGFKASPLTFPRDGQKVGHHVRDVAAPKGRRAAPACDGAPALRGTRLGLECRIAAR